MDNIFIERLWRSLKYEEVYLKNYASVMEAPTAIDSYFRFYNYERLNQSGVSGLRPRSTRAGYKSDDPAVKKEQGITEFWLCPNFLGLTFCARMFILYWRHLNVGHRDANRAPIQKAGMARGGFDADSVPYTKSAPPNVSKLKAKWA